MIGNNQPVEWAFEPRGNTEGRGNFFALGKPIGVVGRKCCESEASIRRESRVKVGVPEQYLVRKVPLQIR